MQPYKTKKEMIYQSLKKRIYNGEFLPGQKLVIAKLALEFDCSEIPVREALNLLESDKLIFFKPHVGAIVSDLSKEELKNIFGVRTVLESYATFLAASQLKNDDFLILEKILDEANEAYQKQDYAKYTSLNHSFHMSIYKYSGNALLVELISDLWKNANRFDSVFDKNDEYIQQSNDEHAEILTLLKERNSEGAQSKMLQHMQRVSSEVIYVSEKKHNT